MLFSELSVGIMTTLSTHARHTLCRQMPSYTQEG